MPFLSNLVNSCDEEPIPVHKLLECEPDRVARPPDPDRLQHPGVAQLSAAKLTVKYLKNNEQSMLCMKGLFNLGYLWLLELIRLHTSDKEGVALP